MTDPRIALIHAVTVAVEPVHAAFRSGWPEAFCSDLLDNTLSPDLARDGELTEAIFARIRTLARYAASTGTDGILFTCSASAIEAAASDRKRPPQQARSRLHRRMEKCNTGR